MKINLEYIKGKLDTAEEYALEHRAWEREQISEIKDLLRQQNGRVRSLEVAMGWAKGLFAMFSILVGWLFKKGI